MNHTLTADSLMHKALCACDSAQLLLTTKDADGACNRAYYAMFDAARAALIISGVTLPIYKTHNGLISAFSLHLVKNGAFPTELGRALNRAEEMRLVADYTGDSIELVDAEKIVEQAVTFVASIRAQLFST